MSPCLHLQKVSCSHNPVKIWSTALPPSPIYSGVRRLPLWSPHPRVQHSQSPISPTISPPPPPLLSFLTPPTHDTAASGPLPAAAAPFLPLYCSSTVSFILPASWLEQWQEDETIALFGSHLILQLTVVCLRALKREPWSFLHLGK